MGKVNKSEPEVPDFFIKALGKNIKARRTFENLPYSHQREYVEWVTEAKREETRERRMASAIKMLSKGRKRN